MVSKAKRYAFFVVKNFGPSLIAVLITHFLFPYFVPQNQFTWVMELAVDAIVFGVVSLITFAFEIYKLRAPVSLIFSISDILPQARGVMVKFVENVLNDCKITLAQLGGLGCHSES